MGHTTALRLYRSLKSSVCASCHPNLLVKSFFLPPGRPFSNSSRTLDARKDEEPGGYMDNLLVAVGSKFQRKGSSYGVSYGDVVPKRGDFPETGNLAKQEWEEEERHHLHIYAHKHNTHITLSKPDRNSLISVSCGNIGFKKAGRGSYDAAYQLAAFVMSRIQDKGLLPQIDRLEIIYRGFGPGREAVTKAILGSEGQKIRPLICKLSDGTRLKFGGTRSKKPRRLG
ncbi:translational machinery component [Pleomassaria siparia CBS 279.74]|uniref:Small ribosomal subunit protein uS11m n=1 Tax=Pleomassaria siparia CBS 279.74 TaxID=1314801 RepID=A0A6G1JVB9_9PLEO|nr:translational machinery component [Pleomassaria siparia CBS 279.74]